MPTSTSSANRFYLLLLLGAILSLAMSAAIWVVLKNNFAGYSWDFSPIIVAPLLAIYSAYLGKKKYLSGEKSITSFLVMNVVATIAYVAGYYLLINIFT